MATKAITQEQAMQQFQEAEDKAIMAGADMEDISSIRTRAGLEPVEFIEPVEGFEPVEEVPLAWNAPSAKEFAQKLQAATGISDIEKEQVWQDLATSGNSALAEEYISGLKEQEKLAKADAAASLVVDVGADAASQFLLQELATLNPDLVTESAELSLAPEQPEESFFDALDKERDIRNSLQAEYREAMQFSGSTMGNVLEFTEVMFPGLMQESLRKLGSMLKEKFNAPLDSDVFAFVAAGEYAETAREWIASLPAEEQLEVFHAVRDSADEWAGIFTDNDFIKLDTMEKLFATTADTKLEEDMALSQGADNVVSLLDLYLVGSLAKGASRAISGTRKASALSSATRINKKTGEQLAASVIKDSTGEAAENLGATHADVVADTMLAKWKNFSESAKDVEAAALTGVSARTVERAVKTMRELEARTVDIGTHMTDIEKLRQKEHIEKSFESVEPMYLNVGKSTFNNTDEGIEASGIYSKAENTGFASDELAAAKTRLLQQHPEGKVEEFVQDGQTFLKLSVKEDYKAGRNAFIDMADIYGRGAKAKYLGDISSNLSKNLSDSFYVAFDSSRGHEKLFLDILKPLTSAKNQNKGHALSIMDEARHLDQDIDIPFVLDRLPRDISSKDAQEVVDSVFSIKAMTDAAYVLENKVFRNNQIAAGRRHVSYGEFDTLATPVLRENTSGIRTAFDPTTNSVVPVNKAMLDDLYEEGGQVVKSGWAVGDDVANQTEFVLVKNGVQVKELPQQVLKYDSNYLTTLYKDQYFIQTTKTAVVDGVTKTTDAVISTAKNKKEAEKAIEALRKENPDVEYSWKNARELTAQQNAESYDSLRRSTGGLFFSKKGERLKDTAGSLADIEDPVASLQRQAASVSRLVELRPVADLMKQRFINTFPQFSEKGFPKSKNAIVNPDRVVDDKADAARVLWDYINLIENGDTTSRKWQASMIRFGEWLEGKGFDKLGERARKVERDPLSAARSATFMATIALNPARQLLIQSQQYLFLAGLDPKFVLSGQIHRQGGALMLSAIADKSVISKGAAKAAGMEFSEYKQMVDSFKKSGLTEAIDSHLLGRDVMLHLEKEFAKNTLAKGTQTVKNAVSSVMQASKSVGFDMGERLNISGTYALAWKRYKEANPAKALNTKEAQRAIAADARQLALGMNKAGAFGYQDGVFSLATQFFSIQHKAFLAMMRGVPGLSKYGNKAITPQEARRIMSFQLGIYGPAAGLGLTAVIDEGLEQAGVSDLDPEVKQLIYGGMFDVMGNAALSTLTGDETDINFAGHMSAGQGFAENLGTYIKDILGGETSVLELMSGASGMIGSRVSSAYDITSHVFGSGVELTPEMGKQVFDGWASIASGYMQYLKGSTMANVGRWVDKNRAIMPLPATDTEAIVMGLFGLTSQQFSDMYKTFNESKKARTDIDGMSEVAYNSVMQRVGAMAEERDRGFMWLNAQAEAFGVEATVIEGLVGGKNADYFAIMDSLKQKLSTRVGTQDRTFESLLTHAILNNSYGGGAESMIDSMQRNGLVDEETAVKLRVFVEKGLGGSE